jgi:hypothetical protein
MGPRAFATLEQMALVRLQIIPDHNGQGSRASWTAIPFERGQNCGVIKGSFRAEPQ